MAIRRSLRTGAPGCRTLRDQMDATERAACDERFGQAAADTGARRSPGGRRLDDSERRTREGFDEQAEANEAWRAYVQGDGPYPGLRSLARHH